MKQLAKALFSNQKGVDLDKRFEIMDRWTFLMMQVFEAKSFLDLAESTHAIDTYSSLDEVLTQQALFRACLLSYGKCFASSGKGRSSLDPKKVFAKSKELLPVHYRLIDLRNKFAAHNDVSGLDEAIIDIEERDDEFLLSHRFAFANPLNEYTSYRKAIEVIEENVTDGTNKALDSLASRLGKKMTLRNS